MSNQLAIGRQVPWEWSLAGRHRRLITRHWRSPIHPAPDRLPVCRACTPPPPRRSEAMARRICASFVIAAALLAATVVLVPTSERDASAQTSGICGRNSEIQRLILAELSRLQTNGDITNAPTTCGAVTSTHLGAIGSLNAGSHSTLSPALDIGALTSGDFAGLTSMFAVILGDVGITSIGADTFNGLTLVDRLDLHCNDFRAAGAISVNAFRGIGSGVAAGRVVGINLSSSGIRSLPADVFRPHTRLTELKLGVHIEGGATTPTCPSNPQNALTSLDVDQFRYNTDLQDLDITGNRLTAIHRDQFRYNTKLRFLELGDNAIATVPKSAFDTNSWLARVNLSGNRLTAIDPKWFQNKKWLNNLDVRNNNITTIPANWLSGSMRLSGDPSLPESSANPAAGQVYLGSNPIAAMHDEAFASPHTVRIQQLYISRTALTEIPPAFDDLTEMTFLFMQRGSLSRLQEDDFVNNTKLTLMRFDNARIADIEPGAFNGLTSLGSLNVMNNRITEIRAGAFTDLPSLQLLWIHGNPLNKIADDAFDGSWANSAGNQLAVYYSFTAPANPVKEIPAGLFKDFEMVPGFLAVGLAPALTYDLPIYVYVVDSDTAKLYMPTGAPVDFTVDLAAEDATLTDAGGDPVASVSFGVGDQFSAEEFDFTPDADDSRPTVSLTPQLTRPGGHFGYEVVDGGQTPPANAEAFAFDNAITLRWDGPDANNLVYVYQYRYRPSGQTWSEWIDHAVQAELPRQLATIDGLASMTTYEIDLRAVSIRGTSEPALLSATTGLLEFRPGGADESSLALSAVGGVEIIDLTWNMPSSTEPIVSYRHRHRVSGTTEWSAWTVESVEDLDAAGDPPMYTSTIWDLEPATTYLVQLQALQEGTLPSHSATATATTVWTFPEINKIEPHIRHFTVHTGGRVRLTVNVYDRQDGIANTKADSMTEEFAAVRTRYIWSDGDSGGEFDTPSDTRMIYYTAQDGPGMHTITAGVSPPGLCVGQLETPRPIPDPCVATFTVNVVTYQTEAEQAETPVNPSGAIPTSIPDANGVAYATASPVEGGTFTSPNGEATLAVPPNAVPNGQLIGVRVEGSLLAVIPEDASGRFALAAAVYVVSAVGSNGLPVTGYVLEAPAQVCVPVPNPFRQQLSDISAVRLHSPSEAGETVEVLQTTLRAGLNGALTACGALSELPARVAAAKFGVDQESPGDAAGEIESDAGLPDAGGLVPSTAWLARVILVALGILVIGGLHMQVIGTRRPNRHGIRRV